MTATVCPNCGTCYEASSEETASEPLWSDRRARWCAPCIEADRLGYARARRPRFESGATCERSGGDLEPDA